MWGGVVGVSVGGSGGSECGGGVGVSVGGSGGSECGGEWWE